jgi:hypothetical protein
MNAEMIINLKTAKMLSITLKRCPLLGRARIEQLTNYNYPDVRFWGQMRSADRIEQCLPA